MALILLVEDNDLIAKLYKEKIERSGYLIELSSSVSEALTKLSKQEYSLILLDIMLAGNQNGFDLLEIMKKDNKYKSIPVIVVTNLDGQEKTAFEMGASDYLVKSNITLDTLLEKINNLLK